MITGYRFSFSNSKKGGQKNFGLVRKEQKKYGEEKESCTKKESGKKESCTKKEKESSEEKKEKIKQKWQSPVSIVPQLVGL